jgi:hypothetical protein
MTGTITINRAPVLTLWAAVVAERLGYSRNEALTLGRAMAGMNAQAKAVHLGLREPTPPGERAPKRATSGQQAVELLGRAVPVLRTPKGLRAAKDGKPESADAVERYLAGKFGDSLDGARSAMTALAARFTPDELAANAYALYERFRPEIPAGTRGWGAKGVLDLAALAQLKPRGVRMSPKG